MKNEKKDFIPILLYVACFIITLIFSIVMVRTKNITDESTIQNMSSFYSYVFYAITFVILVMIYRTRIKEDFKKLDKKKVKSIIIDAIILIIINFLLSTFISMGQVKMENQEIVANSIFEGGLFPIVSVVLLVPFIEEMVFRYSFSTIIKSRKAFIIISSIIFGLLHADFSIVSIIYIVVGILLSRIYLKNDNNVLSSTMAHVLNNLFSVVLMLL